MTEMYTIFSSPLGELLAAGTDLAVTVVSRDPDNFIRNHPRMLQAESGSIVSNAANAIRSYLNSAISIIRIPHMAQGTPFEQQVWKQLCLIPYGQTATYSHIAERIGKPTAFRAVANACGRNPVPLLIPCHRATHKNKGKSGFVWGAETKQFLLELESGHLQKMAA